jgi:hypothetical protein
MRILTYRKKPIRQLRPSRRDLAVAFFLVLGAAAAGVGALMFLGSLLLWWHEGAPLWVVVLWLLVSWGAIGLGWLCTRSAMQRLRNHHEESRRGITRDQTPPPE